MRSHGLEQVKLTQATLLREHARFQKIIDSDKQKMENLERELRNDAHMKTYEVQTLHQKNLVLRIKSYQTKNHSEIKSSMICMHKFVDRITHVYMKTARLKHFIHNQFENIHKFSHLQIHII